MGLLDSIFNALSGGVSGSLQAGEESAAEFKTIWGSAYGSTPPDDALRSVRNIAMTIVTHMNGGNHSYGVQKIEEDMKIYSRAVAGDREKIELVIVYFMNKCIVNGEVSRKLQWVIPPLAAALPGYYF